MAPVVRNKDQQVTVGNTYLLDTGLSNAVTIEKCTFLKFAVLFLVFDSPIEYQHRNIEATNLHVPLYFATVLIFSSSER